jgi:hypothetical protein
MINSELAAFLQEGVGIQLGTCNADRQPDGVRVVAVSVDEAGAHVVAYVPAIAAARVLPDLESTGAAAIVFGRPPDERACQVKGTFAGSWAAAEDERAFVEAQWSRWLDRLASVGLPRAAFDSWTTWPCVAIRVRVTALFNQTPGPGAGASLT